MLIRRYDWFFWVMQFSPLPLQPRCHTIPFMYWSNSFLQLFREFFTSHTPFGGCSSFLVSFPLIYVHGLLLLLCFWTTWAVVLELQCKMFTDSERGAALLTAGLKKQSSCWTEASYSDDSWVPVKDRWWCIVRHNRFLVMLLIYGWLTLNQISLLTFRV